MSPRNQTDLAKRTAHLDEAQDRDYESQHLTRKEADKAVLLGGGGVDVARGGLVISQRPGQAW